MNRLSSSKKPRVNYVPTEFPIEVGKPALVWPLNHPNHLRGHSVSNEKVTYTSPVIAYTEDTGEFETRNTIYVRAEQ